MSARNDPDPSPAGKATSRRPRRSPQKALNGAAHPKVASDPESCPGGATGPSQQQFLSLLAAGCPEGLHFLVARKVFVTDEATGKVKAVYPAEEWREQPLTGPWFFSTGASDSKKHRKKGNLKALRAIVIDDVGTKIDPAKLKLPPTWKLESSPGNFQWGYLLTEWSTEIGAGDALMQALIDAGLQDKGVNACCRLFRLPGSVNDKPGRDSFVSAVTEWAPQRVYPLVGVALGLGVRPQRSAPREMPKGPNPHTDDPRFNWAIDNLGWAGHASGGWELVTCPWAEEHTTQPDDTTCQIMARNHPESKTQCFNVVCFHAHGGDRSAYRKRFLTWLVEHGGPNDHDGLHAAGVALKQRDTALERSTGATYTARSLAADLGEIPVSVLPFADVTKNGFSKLQPITTDNVEAALAHLGVTPRFSMMDCSVEYVLPARIDVARFPNVARKQLHKMVVAALCDTLARTGMRNRKEVKARIAELADNIRFHPAIDWIESKSWDGTDRFEALLETVTPWDENEARMLRIYLHRWLLQCIECIFGWRVRERSQKGLVLTLVGEQDMGKSKWLLSLAPGFSTGGKHLNLNGSNARDSKHEALKAAIVELGELDTTFKKTDAGATKAFITNDWDEYRMPYAEDWSERSRCTSFCASVNHVEFLRDPTGSRRFGAVGITRCDHLHKVDMQQLFAQYLRLWQNGEPWYLTADEKALQIASNEQFQEVDGVVEAVTADLERRVRFPSAYPLAQHIGTATLARLCNGLDYTKPGVLRSVGEAARAIWGRPTDKRYQGGAQRGWFVNVNSNEAEALGLLAAPPRPHPGVTK